MLFIELIAGLLFIGVIIGIVLILTIILPRLVKSWSHAHSLDGKIDRKQEALAETEKYLRELAHEINTEVNETRKLMLETYYDLTLKKRDQLAVELESLKDQRAQEQFENSMRRRLW